MKSDIDEILTAIKKARPELTIRQLAVTHPSDDNGLWFVSLEGYSDIQFESSDGNCPFLIESDLSNSIIAYSVKEVVSEILENFQKLKSG